MEEDESSLLGVFRESMANLGFRVLGLIWNGEIGHELEIQSFIRRS